MRAPLWSAACSAGHNGEIAQIETSESSAHRMPGAAYRIR
jgi:hypothetical protein